MKYPHINFLKNEKNYIQATEYWKMICLTIIERSGQKNEWSPWFGIHQPGEVVRIEEGPIWSLYSKRQNKGLSIEQYPLKKRGPTISGFPDTFGDFQLLNPIFCLRIACSLTKGSEKIAKSLITIWIDPETDLWDMREFTRDMLGKTYARRVL